LVLLREEFDDWAVLYDPDTGYGFGLNPTGSVLVMGHRVVTATLARAPLGAAIPEAAVPGRPTAIPGVVLQPAPDFRTRACPEAAHLTAVTGPARRPPIPAMAGVPLVVVLRPASAGLAVRLRLVALAVDSGWRRDWRGTSIFSLLRLEHTRNGPVSHNVPSVPGFRRNGADCLQRKRSSWKRELRSLSGLRRQPLGNEVSGSFPRSLGTQVALTLVTSSRPLFGLGRDRAEKGKHRCE
jgi:hypothetical protein